MKNKVHEIQNAIQNRPSLGSALCSPPMTCPGALQAEGTMLRECSLICYKSVAMMVPPPTVLCDDGHPCLSPLLSTNPHTGPRAADWPCALKEGNGGRKVCPGRGT